MHSFKRVLLNNGNNHISVPVSYSTKMKEEYKGTFYAVLENLNNAKKLMIDNFRFEIS